METLFPKFTQLPKRKIPKKSELVTKKADNNKDTVPGWQCKTPISDSGAICKRSFYEKQQCIDHIRKEHPNGGGKICKVLVRKKNNNKPEINKPTQQEKKQEVQVFRCCFCTGKYETIEKFKEHVTNEHNHAWYAQLAKKNRSAGVTYLFHCRMCSMRSYKFSTLKTHIQQHTFQQQFRTALRVQNLFSSQSPCITSKPAAPPKSRSRISCHFCSASSLTREELVRHLAQEHHISPPQVTALYGYISS